MDHKVRTFLHFFTLHLLLIGAINWGILGITGYNLISRGTQFFGVYDLSYILYIMIGIAAVLYIYFFYNESIHLHSVAAENTLPVHVLSLTTPLDYDHEVLVKAPEDAEYVLYWTTKPDTRLEDTRKKGYEEEQENEKLDDELTAFGDYANSGVVKVVDHKAVMKFKSPRAYTNMFGMRVEPSLFYKWISKDSKLSSAMEYKLK